MYDLETDPHELDNLIERDDYAEIEKRLAVAMLDGWDPDAINANRLQSQKERLRVHDTTGCEPNWAFRFRPDDGERFVRNASAVGTKIKARYPFVEPTPFEK